MQLLQGLGTSAITTAKVDASPLILVVDPTLCV
jgi:hypothetical protein